MNPEAHSIPPSANGWGYRPHIDGLRCLAVYLVVLFHSGAGVFRGGFVGVDLFFILSGFLVTNVLLADASTAGRIRFARFYARRARRLIPAASVAIVGVCVIAVLVSSPLDRQTILPDARAASMWYANWHFITQSNDYFAADNLESPLLHFWSLAIEEQFYLVFPVVLYGVIRMTRRRLSVVSAVLGGLLVVGIAVQLFWAQRDTNHAYLGTNARLYQPLAGAVLALVLWRYRLPTIRGRVGSVLFGGSTLALVVLATDMVNVNTSIRGLLATGASLGLIVGGELAPSGWIAGTLSWKPIRYLGAISYGTYLWHWPVVAFGHRLLSVSPKAMFVLSAALGTGLAALSYEILELPLRTTTRFRPYRVATIAVGISTALVVGLVISPTLLDRPGPALVQPIATVGSSGSTPVPSLDWQAVNKDKPNHPVCFDADGSDCLIRDGSGARVVLIGDSIAQMWSSTLTVLAEQYDWQLYLIYFPGCPWPTGIHGAWSNKKSIDRCNKLNDIKYQQVDAINPELIVLTERGTGGERATQLRATDPAYSGLAGADLLRRSITDSVAKLKTPERKILLIEPIPEVATGPLRCLSEAEFVEQCNLPEVSNSFEEQIYRDIANADDGIVALDVDREICTEICPPIIDNVVVRRDPSHLTRAYANRLAPQFDGALASLQIDG